MNSKAGQIAGQHGNEFISCMNHQHHNHSLTRSRRQAGSLAVT